jgi:ABC-2 type transport system permease protein
MEYKLDFFFSMLSNLLATIMGMVFIVFLINGDNIKSIRGWTREEVLFIYGYSMLPMAVFGTFAFNLYQFGDKYVIQGQFDRVLLRPLNTLFQVLFESFNLESIGSFLTGIAVVLYASNKMGHSFGIPETIWLFLSAISGGVIMISVFVVVSAASFFFEDRMGIAAPVYNLSNFGRYPLPIFGKVIQFILSWVIPFAFVSFFPATFFLKREGFNLLCFFSPVMAVITAFVASVVWKAGIKRYGSVGN